MFSAHLTVASFAIAAQTYISPIPEVSTAKALLSYVAGNLMLLIYLKSTSSLSILHLISHFFTLNTTFLVTATILTLIRRLYFSPLCIYPGPKLAAASKIWAANEYRLGRHSRTVKALHQQYESDIVRIGPNEVSIRHVDAVERVYKGRYPRGTFYEVGAINGEFNLNTTRDNAVHAVWRRIWERAFAGAEIKKYSERVEYHVEGLMQVLRRAEGKQVNVSKTMDDFVFDVMADLSFAHDAGMQEGRGDGVYMNFIHKYMNVVGPVGSLRNLCQLLIYLPQSGDLKAFQAYGDALLANRQKLGTTRSDIFSHLLASDNETKQSFTQGELNSNANLAIVTGADTTSSCLAQCFGELAQNERVQQKLRDEVGEFKDGELTIEKVQSLPYLNGVVNEALRLFNPVPTGVQASIPSTGLSLSLSSSSDDGDGDGRTEQVSLPPNIQVQIPHLVLMTDPRYFPRPEEFLPERWTDEAASLDLARRDTKRAFIPFGVGVHSCVGRRLAVNEMKIVVARTVREFVVAKGEKWDMDRFQREWMDFAVVKIGNLWVKFVPRS